MRIRLQAIVLTAAVLLVSSLVPAAAGQAASPSPAVRQIPGLTAKDAYPNGCVDCHIVSKDADGRIGALMATWTSAVPAALTEKARASSVDASKIKGKHPAVANVKANIPQTCIAACHKPGSTTAPPFARLMHVIHLTGGSGNRFLTANQGECMHCHKLDQKTGTWKTASSAEK
ncbi:MAG: hypothetical protein ABL982_22140 [Vicinamibacterales bacterium]